MAGHRFWRIIATLLLINQISTTLAVCYYPNGGLAPNDVPCQDVTTHAACCGPGYACLTNGICQATGNELLEPGATEFVRGSCTDKDWRGSGCPAFCINPKLNNLGGGHGIGKCTKRKEDMYYCIDAEHNEDSCGTNGALFFPGTPSAITTIGVAATTSKPATSASTASALTTKVSSTNTIGSVATTLPTTPSTPTATADPASANAQPQSNNTAIIAGVVAGVLGGIILGGLAVWLVIRIRKRRKAQNQQSADVAGFAGVAGHALQHNPDKSASHNWYLAQQQQQQHTQHDIGREGYDNGWNGNDAGAGTSRGRNAPPVYHEADHGGAVMELPADHRW